MNDDGIPTPNYLVNWKGKNGLYCVVLLRSGFYGAAADEKNIAIDVRSIRQNIWNSETVL